MCVSSSIRHFGQGGTHFLQRSPALVFHTYCFKQTAPEDNKSLLYFWVPAHDITGYVDQEYWSFFTCASDTGHAGSIQQSVR